MSDVLTEHPLCLRALISSRSTPSSIWLHLFSNSKNREAFPSRFLSPTYTSKSALTVFVHFAKNGTNATPHASEQLCGKSSLHDGVGGIEWKSIGVGARQHASFISLARSANWCNEQSASSDIPLFALLLALACEVGGAVCVGAFAGVAVSEGLGVLGDTVGKSVGESVDVPVGDRVGVPVGDFVGAAVGFLVGGFVVGLLVGGSLTQLPQQHEPEYVQQSCPPAQQPHWQHVPWKPLTAR